MKESLIFVLIFVVIIIIGWVLTSSQTINNHNYIKDWAKENKYTVESIEEPWFDTGPFWVRGKHQRIYKAVLIDELEHKRTSYFRTGVIGYDQAWEDSSNN